MEYHSISNIFPMMSDSEYQALKNDIRENGLVEKIWLYEGKILDGRNRYKACLELDITPKYNDWDGNGSALSFVISLNLKRRHLNSSQLAFCALEAERELAKVAKERQRDHAGTAPGKSKTLPQKIAEVNEGEARDQAAKLFNTNRQYVSDAKAIEKKAPKMAMEIKEGKKTISQAKREITHQELKENIPDLPPDKYRVLYADPPWKYGSDFKGMSEEDSRRWTAAETHYPPMTIAELCLLEIKELTQDNAVLFMWVTSPLLSECWPVIASWGFKYKSSFVWDKVAHNFGHYNSVRHEFLLVCTRGSCLPDNGKLNDSVIEIKKSREHSKKPQEFRDLIDRMYPDGNRIELFARGELPEHWDTWGNE